MKPVFSGHIPMCGTMQLAREPIPDVIQPAQRFAVTDKKFPLHGSQCTLTECKLSCFNS